jgi:cobalt-zinc-cadmium efflux system outer membrane protein
MTTNSPLGIAILLGLVGCAAVPSDSGFGDVRRDVAARTGRTVRWNRNSADDRAVASAVRGMLQGRLGADEAVQIALLNNRRLQATYEDLGVAQADVVQAGLLRNPIFDGDVKFVEGGGGSLVELAVAQDFLDLLFIPLRRRIAAASFESEKLRVTGAALDLVGEVRVAYYTHAAGEQALELRRTVAAATEASYDLARRMRDAGNITALDLANDRALREQSKLDLARAEATVLDSHERLNVLLGLWGPDAAWSAEGRLRDPAGDEAVAGDVERRAVERSIELALARRQVESAARTLGIRRSLGLLPEASLGAAAEREPDGGWAAGPSLSLPIPLFDQGRAATAGARARLERARQEYVATAVEVRSAARAARDRLLAARARADYYRRVILPLRHEITEQTQRQYNAMLVGAFQLLQARQAEIEAGVDSIDALRDYWIARAQFEQVQSGRTGGIGRDGNSQAAGVSAASARGRGVGGH